MINTTSNKSAHVPKKPAVTVRANGREVFVSQNRNSAYVIPEASNEESDDGEDANNDDETTTSFSLQECINEFRARRVRRISSHSRQEVDKNVAASNGDNDTEIDLINQNLCNKEQERKCKPCKDGFCYCFTSDSGDGSASVQRQTACRGSRGNSRRYRRSECGQEVEGRKLISKDNKQNITANLNSQQSVKKSSNLNVSQLTAVSRLETSHGDAPLIHIIQELRDNCLISEVRVNKSKIQTAYCDPKLGREETRITLVENNFKEPNASKKFDRLSKTLSHKIPFEPQTPTAPVLENEPDLDSQQINGMTSSNIDSSSTTKDSSNRRHKAGGRLLQKRLSNSSFRYKLRDVMNPPPKPPRNSNSFEERSSVSTNSTSPSVREAERVLDEFLASRIYKKSPISDEKAYKKSAKQLRTPLIHKECTVQEKRKPHPMSPKDERKYAKQVLATYPSLSDIEQVLESKKSSQYEKNIRNCEENRPKVFRIGWNEPRIHDMLNCDSNKEFCSTATQAEPQQIIQSAGWQIPPKMDIDTVDGVVRHNMASSIENKDTPVKTQLYQSCKSVKSSETQRFTWSEHLRNLSPWSNKNQGPTKSLKVNLRSSSKDFLKSSKKKILRLVSPKKENKERANIQIRKTPHRNVAIQTSQEDLDRQSFLHSPPGSYHSPMQSSLPQSSAFAESRNIANDNTDFDFSRHIYSPPRKAMRSSQRKLNFPLNCSTSCTAKNDNMEATPNKDMKTYRSFKDLDQDVSLSKMSFILSNIRAKLEASDDRAIKTFLETDNGEHGHIPSVFGCPDDQRNIYQESRIGIQKNNCLRSHNEPIYSEIEDDSIHVSESPNFENHTGIDHFNVNQNPNVLYALVNKSNKQMPMSTGSTANEVQHKSPTPLGKILHDSLKVKRIPPKRTQLSPLMEPPESEVFSSYTSSVGGQLLHCHSMNNVRVMEHNSPPKRQRNLSKSDLSLHRSEIFLENLCKSELIVGRRGSSGNGRWQKIENNIPRQPYVPVSQPSPNFTVDIVSETEPDVSKEDVVSYELPIDDEYGIDDLDYGNSINADSNLVLDTIAAPSTDNQSTPNKPSFTTKDECKDGPLNVDTAAENGTNCNEKVTNSCPNSPIKSNELSQFEPQHTLLSQSLHEFSDYRMNASQLKSINILPTYKRLKTVFYKSLQKSKDFVKKETKRMSTPLSSSTSNERRRGIVNMDTHNLGGGNSISDSAFDLKSLLSVNQDASVNEQLAQVVNICRQFPETEISTEMVEAERLLLFSELRRGNQESTISIPRNRSMDQQAITYLFIDDIYLPIRADTDLDTFFNYFFIVTFECGGVIRSTQSSECQNDFAVFRDCGIEFNLRSDLREGEQNQIVVRCNVFMLRLRKVSTLCSESKITKFPESIKKSSLSPSESVSSASSYDIVSRFRLHASFTLDAKNFAPYEYVEQESLNSDRLCIRSSRICNVMLTSCIKSSKLAGELQLKGRADVRLPKRKYGGYLNVEDPYTQHNWNRRWCTLDGIHLHVWQDENNLNKSPLLSLHLQDAQQNILRPAPRDLCARPRSFCIICTIRKADKDVSTASVFFAADTQCDLNTWLDSLNHTLHFIHSWLL